jgi:tetratricopeptide (TPR) repeat protein
MLTILWFVMSMWMAQSQHDRGGQPAAATLQPGLGHLHHPIATTSPEAQQFFDQGLTLVYGFNHDEAIKAFRRAAELDPASPMPHWGIALALGPNINLDVDPEREKAAFEEGQRARALAASAPANERAYVEALAKRYSNDPKADLKALAVQFKDAMRDLSRQYPDDLDAATLYAESLMDLRPWQLWSNAGAPAEGTEEIVAVLESVLRRDPMHVGANHYYIHAVEASPTPERALVSASRLETLVPAAGHLVHMPAHIYMRTGDYAAAVASNARAAQVDRDYMARTGADGVYPLMYYSHNIDFLASAAMMTGQFAEASRAADEIVVKATAAIAQMPMIEPFAAKKLYVLLRFARWSEVLALPRPDPQHKILTALWRFSRSVAQAALRHTTDAEREREAYVEARGSVPPDTAFNYNSAGAIFGIADAVLEARIAGAKGDHEAAVGAWARAVAAQDALNYDEPPDWFYPVRESHGAALLRIGRFEEGERVFRADLDRNPRNPRSLFGLMQALKAQKKDSAAAIVEKQFEAAWQRADVPLRLTDF